MDEKLNSETQDKQTAPEVKDEALDQVNGAWVEEESSLPFPWYKLRQPGVGL